MVKCKGICVDGKHCKRNVSGEFCSIHDCNIICQICIRRCDIHNRKTIPECGHRFCKNCLCKSVMEKQWFEGFSTKNELHCPTCQIQLKDDSWDNVMDLMVKSGLLKRKIVYNTYLCHEMYCKLLPVITLDHDYDFQGSNFLHHYYDNLTGIWTNRYTFLNEHKPDIVYFEKVNPTDWRFGRNKELKKYKFFFGDPACKIDTFLFLKELVEYVYHPSRINFEEF